MQIFRPLTIKVWSGHRLRRKHHNNTSLFGLYYYFAVCLHKNGNSVLLVFYKKSIQIFVNICYCFRHSQILFEVYIPHKLLFTSYYVICFANVFLPFIFYYLYMAINRKYCLVMGHPKRMSSDTKGNSRTLIFIFNVLLLVKKRYSRVLLYF